jgi:hypothetical protein
MMFGALSCRSWLETLDAYISSHCLGSNTCLAMLRPVVSGDFLSPIRWEMSSHSWLYLLS